MMPSQKVSVTFTNIVAFGFLRCTLTRIRCVVGRCLVHQIITGIQDDETKVDESQAVEEVGVPLPDIKQALQKKAIEKEMEKLEEEKEAQKVKIKRSDKEAFTKVR